MLDDDESVRRPFQAEPLLQSIRTAVDVSVARHRDHQELSWLQSRFERLTLREREVCRQTIKIHRARDVAKREVKSVAELVRFVDRLHPPIPVH